MTRSMALRWLVAAGSIAFFAIACEGLVRLIDPEIALPGDERRFRFDQRHQRSVLYHERDDELGWRLVRNQLVRSAVVPEDGSSAEAATETPPMRTNREGFRGPDFEIQKGPGVFRVLVAGDSNAMGFGVAHDDRIYSAGLEYLLDRRVASDGIRVEVVNLGVDGFSSHQVRLVLQRYAPAMEPDAVCVQVGFNDMCLAPLADADQRYARPRLLNVLERSHAYRWLRRRILLVAGTRGADRDPVPRVSPEQHQANVAAIAELCRDVGAPLYLLTTPPKPDIPVVLNEVPIEENGVRIWMTQSAWLDRELERAGVPSPRPPDDPRCLSVVEDAIARHPDWAMLHFMHSRFLLAAGDRDGAIAAHRQAMSHDTQRAQLRGYMDRQLRVAESHPHVTQVDVGAAIDRWVRENRITTAGELYFDFVHLGERGHAVIATELASRLEATIRERTRAASRRGRRVTRRRGRGPVQVPPFSARR